MLCWAAARLGRPEANWAEDEKGRAGRERRGERWATQKGKSWARE